MMRNGPDSDLLESEFDVIIVGSGAGGMLAAIRAQDLGLKAAVLEKSDRYGGTSAVSGGAIWIPNNRALQGKDSSEKAMEYLLACTEEKVPRTKLARYIETAPKLVDYLASLGVEYYVHPTLTYPDYYPWLTGSLTGGRTMFVRPLEDGGVLGEEFFRLRESYPEFKLLEKISLDMEEGSALLYRKPGWIKALISVLARYWTDWGWRRRTHRDRRLTIGNALIGGLRKAMMERGIPLLLNTRMTGLVVENGRVTGVKIEREGQPAQLSAGRGVVLASGGFERSQALRERHLDHLTREDWSGTPRDNNVGDALVAAQSIGAETEFLSEAWWVPTIRLPSRQAPNTNRHQALFFELGLPHSLCVNRNGVRFTNEINSYHHFGQEMMRDQVNTGANLPCWFVFDAEYRRKYPLGSLLPGRVVDDSKLPPDSFDNLLYKADTFEQLAGKINVPPKALEETVARYNGFASTGDDVDFGRGGNVYNLYFGDPSQKPNRTLGPLLKAPFYAVRIDLGDLGTKGGPKTDEFARVMDTQGEPIIGLYAIGNAAGSVMGSAYPGAGATLGSAMTFGLVAAEHLADTDFSNDVQPALSAYPETRLA
ncbi:FAD-dependent oxidoreductase [Pseudomonas sp. H11T01]|uniref:FAD-dependent oxidoreductase n=1 Tax=Pseudomonas sp. H11T01 TaxID=3402749 RepID=UPI003AC732BF